MQKEYCLICANISVFTSLGYLIWVGRNLVAGYALQYPIVENPAGSFLLVESPPPLRLTVVISHSLQPDAVLEVVLIKKWSENEFISI
jgi:hypothetical protein